MFVGMVCQLCARGDERVIRIKISTKRQCDRARGAPRELGAAAHVALEAALLGAVCQGLPQAVLVRRRSVSVLLNIWLATIFIDTLCP
jgi:hypothetical protein